MKRAIDRACRSSEVPLRALWCKVRVRCWFACDRPPQEKRKKKREEGREDIHIEVSVLIL
jgi:hypothetical protein